METDLDALVCVREIEAVVALEYLGVVDLVIVLGVDLDLGVVA